jgi:hypothetical protein
MAQGAQIKSGVDVAAIGDGTLVNGDNAIPLHIGKRGRIRRLVVRQTVDGGGQAGFSFQLYSRKDAVPGQTSALAANDKLLYKLGAQTTIAGGTAFSEGFGLDIPYQNEDLESVAGKAGGSVIYLHLNVTSATGKTFKIAWTVEQTT